MNIRKYLREQKRVFILGSIGFGIVAVCFLLYHLPIAAVSYPFLLCFTTIVIYILAQYEREKERLERLKDCHDTLLVKKADFEEPTTLKEEIYQQMVLELQRNLQEYSAVSNEKYHEMIDYYTMWVHQIKTPIASMRLTLEAMDSPEERKLMAELFRVEQYVNMVLTYLRLNADASDYVLKEYSLDDLLKTTIRRFSSEFINRHLSLSYEPVNQTVITDEKWFLFVLEQVLSNALKYTKEGGIKIYLERDQLVIEDSGIGIAPEDVPRIFEKGYTGYNGRIDKKASGIGLYLCKKICDKLRLPISAESVVSKGTKIKIRITQDEICVKD